MRLAPSCSILLSLEAIASGCFALAPPLQAGCCRPVQVGMRDQPGNTMRVRRILFEGADDSIFRDGFD